MRVEDPAPAIHGGAAQQGRDDPFVRGLGEGEDLMSELFRGENVVREPDDEAHIPEGIILRKNLKCPLEPLFGGISEEIYRIAPVPELREK